MSQKAVFLAAGMGTRLLPLTEKRPKPLVKVAGKRIIDTTIKACLSAGIDEIYIVRGYLADAFDELKKDYSNIQFIENPDWAVSNNIASIVYASDLLENVYIIEGDLYLQNPDLITPYQKESAYVSIPIEKTDDWCFYTDNEGYITQMSVGGEDCELMVGISYWTKEDGRKLAEYARKLYREEKYHNLYWDQIALEIYLSEFKVKTRRCGKNDVIEIDTVDEHRRLEEKLNGAKNTP